VVDSAVAEACWSREGEALRRFAQRRRKTGAAIYVGTHLGILRGELVQHEMEEYGPFEVIIFDEAGMARLDEFLLCLQLAARAIVFGDHQQLPPHPPSSAVVTQLVEEIGPLPTSQWSLLQGSALQWLAEMRHFPVALLQCSYRCQNPRLMRFASTLFYNARVQPSDEADYYKLPYAERQRRYPSATLRFYCTSSLPTELRCQRLIVEGGRTGFENRTEAALCLAAFQQALQSYPLAEITLIAPYRRQVRLLRRALAQFRLERLTGELAPGDEEWEHFLHTRVSTVDSFQGGESDAIIICYVRSNEEGRIGFVDDPNRVNVAHTRARRHMAVVGDLECLKEGEKNRIFARMERAFRRDGEVIDVPREMIDEWLPLVP